MLLRRLSNWGLLSICIAAALPCLADHALAKGPAAESAQAPSKVEHGRETHRATVHIGELSRREAAKPRAREKQRAIGKPLREPKRPLPGVQSPATAAPQRAGAVVLSPALSTGFLALADSTTVIPPDTDGAVGPNHVVTALNSQVIVQSRTGSTITAAVSLNAFFAPLGAVVTSVFDPHIVYEPYQNRWLISALNGTGASDSALLVGVSAGPDPTGTWYLYSIVNDSAKALFADYDLIGFNKDWVVVTINQFNSTLTSFVRADVFAFNKANLLANAGASYTRIQVTTTDAALKPAITFDSSVSGLYLLNEWNGANALLKLWQLTGAVGSESLNPVTTGSIFGPGFVQFPATWSEAPASEFLPQLGIATKIDEGDTRIHTLMYRNGSLWTTHTIFLPANSNTPPTPTRSSIQWAQLSTAGAIVQSGLIDDPTGAIFYAYPSLGVNRNGDVLIGYSEFSSTTYPSAAYAYRAAGDPAGTLQAEVQLKAGEGSYFKTFGAGSNRWGDYSVTMPDPRNDTDFWTIQEYAATPVGTPSVDGSGRWGTWWGYVQAPRTASAVKVSVSPTTAVAGQTVTLTAIVTGASPTGTVQFQVNGVNVGSPVPVVNGIATLTTVLANVPGSFTIDAIYYGDGANESSTSSGVVETVTAAAAAGSADVPLPLWSLFALGGLLLLGIRATGAVSRGH